MGGQLAGRTYIILLVLVSKLPGLNNSIHSVKYDTEKSHENDKDKSYLL